MKLENKNDNPYVYTAYLKDDIVVNAEDDDVRKLMDIFSQPSTDYIIQTLGEGKPNTDDYPFAIELKLPFPLTYIPYKGKNYLTREIQNPYGEGLWRIALYDLELVMLNDYPNAKDKAHLEEIDISIAYYADDEEFLTGKLYADYE